jgi:hypothetical protein
MRLVLAALMAMHGVAHLVGFAGAWQLAPAKEIPYKTTVLAGHAQLGDVGIRVMGILWLLAALAFIAAAGGAVFNARWWINAALIVTAVSLAMTIVEWPEARLGLVVNVAILAALLLLFRPGLEFRALP